MYYEKDKQIQTARKNGEFIKMYCTSFEARNN